MPQPVSLLAVAPLDFWGLDSQLSLYSLLVLTVLSSFALRRMSLSWGWPFLVKIILIVVVAVLGLLVGPMWLYSMIGWGLFVVMFLTPLIILKILGKYIAALNGRKVVETVGLLRWFYWGKVGRFWSDWASAFALYIDGRKSEADEVLARWNGETVPEQLKSLANDYRFYGYVLARDWPRLISEYESLRSSGETIPNHLYLSTSRAYGESKQFDRAAECLALATVPETRNGAYDHAPAFLQFFCLTGDASRTNQLLDILIGLKHPLPSYAKSYWLGRLHVAKGEGGEAKSRFDTALKQSSIAPLWQSRIRDQLKKLEDGLSSTVEQNTDAQTANASISKSHADELESKWQQFKRLVRTLEIVFPVRNSPAVDALACAIIVMFVFSFSYALVPDRTTAMITSYCFEQGMLIPGRVRAGEYWRLLTCVFLHLHFLHALFNLLGLWWFGRMAERIFGTLCFLIIFLGAGIVSSGAYAFLPGTSPALGASGAIMGVFGAVAVGIFRLKNLLPDSIRRKQLMLMVALLSLQLVMDHIIPHIGVSIHLVGLLTGVSLGFILPVPHAGHTK